MHLGCCGCSRCVGVETQRLFMWLGSPLNGVPTPQASGLAAANACWHPCGSSLPRQLTDLFVHMGAPHAHHDAPQGSCQTSSRSTPGRQGVLCVEEQVLQVGGGVYSPNACEKPLQGSSSPICINLSTAWSSGELPDGPWQQTTCWWHAACLCACADMAVPGPARSGEGT